MKHTDSKNCGCAGCIEADHMSRSDVLNMVDVIMKHSKPVGKRIRVLDFERPVISEKKSGGRRPVKLKKYLYDAMMDDAGIPAEERV